MSGGRPETPGTTPRTTDASGRDPESPDPKNRDPETPDPETPDPEGRAAARLLVDLAALVGNYRTIASSTAAEVAGVIKADGYGLGASGLARALYEAGCRTFFTAFAHEAVELRRMLDDVEIFVLMPRVGGEAHLLHRHRLIPCLFDLDGVDRWIGNAAAHGASGRAALHVETGIHRLGLGREELDALIGDPARRSRLDVALVMSHLACADEPSAPANRRQLDRFRALRGAFPAARASLANSAGTFLGPDYHFDLVRPGIALYGHDPHYRHIAPRVRPVATLQARLGQVRTVEAGGSVGYGAVATCDTARRIGVVLAGYADGIPRALYRPGRRFEVVVGGRRAPLFGTVSMDMITIDLGGLPEGGFPEDGFPEDGLPEDGLPEGGFPEGGLPEGGLPEGGLPEGGVRAGAWVEIFGPNAPIERVAEQAGTIPYEILTGIGPRVERVHV